MGKVRGVRFTDAEQKLIEEFLRKNSLLDFSTLAKIAILGFIENPHFSFKPVGKHFKKENRDVRPI